MNRLGQGILFTVLAFAGLSVSAGEGTDIVLDTRALTLPPGTTIRAQITARYELEEMPTLSSSNVGKSIDIADDMIRYRVPATDVAEWRFVVPQSGIVPAKRFILHFKEKMLAPPSGMMATVVFPVTCRLIRPDGRKQERQYTFGMPITVDTASINRCLKINGRPNDGLGVGVVPTCDWVPGKSNLILRDHPAK